MNEFQSIESGKGLLKDSYDKGEPITDALKRRNKKRNDKLPEDVVSKQTLEGDENGN